MSVTVITTPKADNANAYVDVAFADAYFANRLNATVWTGASSDNKAKALIQATRHIEEQVRWDREMCGVRSSLTQALRFPSIAVLTRECDYYYPAETIPYPPFIQNACCEQALFELTTDRTTDPASRGISAVSAGDVSVTFDATGKGASQVLHVLADIVWDILAPWVTNRPNPNGLILVPVVR